MTNGPHKIEVDECPCGNPDCQYFHLKGIGSFDPKICHGFTLEEANLVARLLNDHYRSEWRANHAIDRMRTRISSKLMKRGNGK